MQRAGPGPALRQYSTGGWSCPSARRLDRDVGAAAAPALEAHGAGGGGEEGVVGPHADVGAGMEGGAALAHDDVAGRDDLAAIALHAQALARRVAAVAGAAACFLVCHSATPSWPSRP